MKLKINDYEVPFIKGSVSSNHQDRLSFKIKRDKVKKLLEHIENADDIICYFYYKDITYRFDGTIKDNISNTKETEITMNVIGKLTLI